MTSRGNQGSPKPPPVVNLCNNHKCVSVILLK